MKKFSESYLKTSKISNIFPKNAKSQYNFENFNLIFLICASIRDMIASLRRGGRGRRQLL